MEPSNLKWPWVRATQDGTLFGLSQDREVLFHQNRAVVLLRKNLAAGFVHVGPMLKCLNLLIMSVSTILETKRGVANS
jgi:hypothetical protein